MEYDDYQAPEGAVFWIKVGILSFVFSLIILLITKKQDFLFRIFYVIGGIVGVYLAVSGKLRRKGFVEGKIMKRRSY